MSVPGMVINKIKNMRGKEKSDNFSVIEELQALLPLTVEDVSTCALTNLHYW